MPHFCTGKETRVRIVLFGSGSPLSTAVLAAVADRFSVAAVVVPAVGWRGSLPAEIRNVAGLTLGRPLVRAAQRLGIPTLRMAAGKEVELGARLAPLRADLICVASFPFLLRPPLLDLSRLGAVGVHPSLLPRHRGGWPLFWTYFHDDRESGVTVQWLDAGMDTGDIVLQERIPLPRGEPVTQLYGEIARRGATLLVKAVEAIGSGTAPRIPQDETRATVDSNPAGGSWRREAMTWNSERLWHFLRGLGGRHGELLSDADGRRVAHGRALRFSLEPHDKLVGTLVPLDGGWRVYCRDGVVDTAGPPRWAALRRALRKVFR
jgi:methionyl-tRNA formyltransferase